MDRAISSYTSSIRSLIHSREQIARSTLSVADPQHALLISMADTPSQTSLPFATEEVAVIKPLVASIGLAPVDGGGHTVEVLKHMRSSRIMHFAGHGLSHPLDPTKSSLLTKDWETNPLTVQKLRQQSLQEHSPFLAYLSSCSTGAIKDHSLADEAIHLISACQLAGFRHAIGALWEVSDQHCVDVARIVYETLKEDGLTDQAVARGLHRATRHVRDSSQSMITRSASTTDAAEDALEDQNTKEKLRDLEREFEAFEIHDREGSVEDRDAVPVGSRRRRQEPLGSFFWVPYVHYGA
ncbi:hypothetical protein ASPWEDRAFT_45285 [Aspergillus wentii DTO 134E9]|uniref:CHAT domain-containing protein n=1 Tax=Aspergillus wentii DTO 134E9 TaxID=1073089 RepID=A0A1L9R8U3_ASPWE|nr:uncharacterized protein ASPWEDRAFT_45285 [Aspergillus wentii DTO 134E9]OJJ31342.1 hypothetical protein ASPWEDRAFT_45285 [Aspergillus wentii DTO 134E9]